MEEKKVLVTGASGMLGTHIVRDLINKGFSVRCLVQRGVNAKTLADFDIEITYGDLTDLNSLIIGTRDCHFVIHTAAMTNIWPYRSERVMLTNYQGVINLAEACRINAVERLVHIGSASSFAPGSLESPGDEQRKFNGWKFGLDYMNSKYIAQEYLLDLHKRSRFPVIILNPTFMIGAYDSGPTSGKLLLYLHKKKLLGYPKGGRNFVCAQHVAEVAVASLKKGTSGECYIVGGDNLTYRQFLETASNVMGHEFKLREVPYPLLYAYAWLNCLFARIRGTVPDVSCASARISNSHHYYSSEKIRRELGVKPMSVQFAIQNSMQWFSKNGYL